MRAVHMIRRNIARGVIATLLLTALPVVAQNAASRPKGKPKGSAPVSTSQRQKNKAPRARAACRADRDGKGVGSLMKNRVYVSRGPPGRTRRSAPATLGWPCLHCAERAGLNGF